MSLSTVSVIGLGKLGASMAAAMASRGMNVIGVDTNPDNVSAINRGLAPVQETGLAELMARESERIRATQDYDDAVRKSELSFVIVPTPSDAQGGFSLQFAAEAFTRIGSALSKKPTYHLVVLTSTVLPGSTRHGLLPLIEGASGKKAGLDFGLCYSPEFIALGSVIHDFLNPDFTLIGELDSQSGEILESAYATIMENDPPCMRMSIENAELTKISLNSFVTTKITFANILAALCERIPGGDVDVVTSALGQDRRIGSRYLKGGLGYGGPCFPRDNLALSYFARAVGVQASLANATHEFNVSIPPKLQDRLVAVLDEDDKIAILGLAYKPSTHVTDESQGVQLAMLLSQAGYPVSGYDPSAGDHVRRELGPAITVHDSIESCLAGARLVIIATPDPAFADLDADSFAGRDGSTVTVMDFWRLLSGKLIDRPGIEYLAIGLDSGSVFNERRLRDLWAPGSSGSVGRK